MKLDPEAILTKEVLDWQGLVGSCPGDCLEADGFHLKPDGRSYYAAVIAGVLGL